MKHILLTALICLMPTAAWTQTEMNLNGDWLFYYAPDKKAADLMEGSGFYRPDFRPVNFRSTPVPSNWAILGYEEPVYRNFKNAPHSEGFYIHRFTLPASMRGKRLLLHFGGVWASAEIWVNGKRLGRHDSGYTSFALNASQALKAGEENVLAVRVRQVYPEYTCDTYDDWALGGIYRDVSIEAMPQKLYIDKLTAVTDFDDSFTDADLKLRTLVQDAHRPTLPGNYRSPGLPYRLRYQLTDPNGQTVADRTCDIPTHISTAREDAVTFHLRRPMQWNAETPYLYRLQVDLIENGSVTQTIRKKIGFREISTAGGVFRINGQAVKLRGVNRHDEWPTVGRATRPEHWIKDLTLMKAANINYIRACHYQHAKGFIEMCDSIGMYVGAEISLGGASGMMQDPAFIPGMMLRATETVERDLNNPSVIYWSVGNEDAFTGMFQLAVRTIKALDPTRPVLLPWNADASLPAEIDILAPHYWTAAQYDSACANSKRPVITTEYVHAYGTQRFGGLQDCWQAITKHPAGTGGAVWMWADQGVVTPTKWTDRVYRTLSGGDPYLRISSDGWDGITDSYRRPTRDYWELQAVYSPLCPDADTVALGKEVRIPVYNGFDFTNAKGCAIQYRVYVDSRPKASGSTYINAAPHTSADLVINPGIGRLGAGQTAYVQLRFFHADGTPMAEKSVVLRGDNDSFIPSKLPRTAARYAFDATTGLPRGLRPVFWHKLNEGDEIIRNRSGFNGKYAIRVEAVRKKATAEGTAYESDIRCTVNDSNSVAVHVTSFYRNDGRLTVNYAITPTTTPRYLPVIGMALRAKPLQWFGKGPAETYPNKQAYGLLGIWDARRLTGTHDARWIDVDGARVYLGPGGFIDRDETDSPEVHLLSSVLGRSEKGRLNDARYHISSGNTYRGTLTIIGR